MFAKKCGVVCNQRVLWAATKLNLVFLMLAFLGEGSQWYFIGIKCWKFAPYMYIIQKDEIYSIIYTGTAREGIAWAPINSDVNEY